MNNIIIIRPELVLQYDWKAVAANPTGVHRPQVDLVAFKALYINKIAQARARGLEPVLVSLPIMDENRYFAYVTRGMSTHERINVLSWLGGETERLRNIYEMYNLALFRLAALQCVHIVDITSPMLKHEQYLSLLELDGVTLSPAGEALVIDACSSLRSHAPFVVAHAAFVPNAA